MCEKRVGADGSVAYVCRRSNLAGLGPSFTVQERPKGLWSVRRRESDRTYFDVIREMTDDPEILAAVDAAERGEKP